MTCSEGEHSRADKSEDNVGACIRQCQSAAKHGSKKGDELKRSKLLLVVVLLFGISVLAQTAHVQAKPLSDDDIKLLRADVQDAKDKIIKDTMQFTGPEDAAFWPVYREYSKQQHAIADQRLGVITDYAQHIENMSVANAQSLTQRMMKVDDETLALRKTYFPQFVKALGAKRAAKFYQVDNRLTLMIDVQLASEVPLIP